jgi:hypothetical protein
MVIFHFSDILGKPEKQATASTTNGLQKYFSFQIRFFGTAI